MTGVDVEAAGVPDRAEITVPDLAINVRGGTNDTWGAGGGEGYWNKQKLKALKAFRDMWVAGRAGAAVMAGIGFYISCADPLSGARLGALTGTLVVLGTNPFHLRSELAFRS